MKVYLDENLPAFLIQPLRVVYHRHEFGSPDDEGLGGVEDIPLLEALSERDYDAIVTKDRTQLKDPAERKAVIDSGLRWVGVSDKKLTGMEFITVTTATLLAGMRFVFEHDPDEPVSYHLHTIPHTQTQRVRLRELR